MKFPITRESLQAFDYAKEQEELFEEQVDKLHNQTLHNICNQFKVSMNSNSKEKRFIWRDMNQLITMHRSIPMGRGHMSMTSKIDEYLPRFVEKLKETFIGCDIIIDPLKTYLIIDWSKTDS